jgi:hypothetical protein
MNTLRMFNYLVGAALCMAPMALSAQESNCEQIVAIARMARAKSSATAAAERHKMGDSYRADVVFAARSLESRPLDKGAAILLLNLIPQDDEQQSTWVTLGDSLCSGESVADMKSLAHVGEHLSRDLARAVRLAPDKLPKYIAYASTSVQDPNSDYAVEMQTVCRANHAQFAEAVAGMPADKREWFIKHVFNPDGCHALALPERD